MNESALADAGLGTNEARVYEALLSLGSSSIERIAAKSRVHRRNIYDVLAKLLEKGLISESFARNRKEYRAIHPSRLLDLVQEKERSVEAALPSLEKSSSA